MVTNPLHSILPDEYIEMMAMAAKRGSLPMVIVLGQKQMEQLNKDGHTGLGMDNGDVYILITADKLEEAYGDDG